MTDSPQLQSVTAALRGVDLFAGLQQFHLERLAGLGSIREYATGDQIFSEGETGDSLYIILAGAVRISRIVAGIGEENLAVLETGNYFGEMALVTDHARSATALVHRKASLFILERQPFHDLLFVDRDVAYVVLWKFVKTLSERLSASNDKMTLLATASRF